MDPVPPSNKRHCLLHQLNIDTSRQPALTQLQQPPFKKEPISYPDIDRLHIIDSGNGGSVYKVMHRPTSRHYALKVIHDNHNTEVCCQIYREIQILRDFEDFNIIKCYSMFKEAGKIERFLEYMDCDSLNNKYTSIEPLLSDYNRQVISDLFYLQQRKIVHRDIKSSNLLMNAENQVKIVDFRASRILEQTMDLCKSHVGTIAYMSPERMNVDSKGWKYDGYAGDIWSLGVSVLELNLEHFHFPVEKGDGWFALMNALPPNLRQKLYMSSGSL